jgi:hypothetical protein
MMKSTKIVIVISDSTRSIDHTHEALLFIELPDYLASFCRGFRDPQSMFYTSRIFEAGLATSWIDNRCQTILIVETTLPAKLPRVPSRCWTSYNAPLLRGSVSIAKAPSS